MTAEAQETGARLTDQQKLAWLRLIRTDSVGPATFNDLIERYGSADTALQELPAIARRVGRQVKVCSVEDASREYDATVRHGACLIGISELNYPPWLRQIDSAPPLIAVRGSTGILTRPMIAIVGSRNASVSGRKIAASIAAEIGTRGFAVVSGLARGIDAAAQQAALASGTVAVFAGGIDQIYPTENIVLSERILAEGGAHLTEMRLGHEPRARDFPRRNRIVSGLAIGSVIVEAAERSGSLITARLASEQGRIVFAVPGSPLDPRAAGTNRLLKDGATIATDAADIIAQVAPMLSVSPTPVPRSLMEPTRPTPAPPIPNDDMRKLLIEAMSPSPIGVDELIRFTNLSPSEVQLALLELDIAGRIERHPGQRVSLI